MLPKERTVLSVYVNSYLMTMNIFEALSREINLNCYGV